jgi:CheY-like chemotaxis protein
VLAGSWPERGRPVGSRTLTTNRHEAIELNPAERPDVVARGHRMPELSGIEATRRIAADPALDHLRVLRVLILTTFERDE